MTTPSDSLAASPAADFTFLTHRLGHGIGLEGHERPYLVPGDVGRKVAQTGNVFSLEPGVYVPRHSRGESYARGLNGVGIRLEDCFVVTERDDGRLGGEWLSGPVRAWGDI
jgi:Xaa-Pro aminopeptidase